MEITYEDHSMQKKVIKGKHGEEYFWKTKEVTPAYSV